ncbi:MAG TPA: acyl carrier protein [Acidobacteriaceae bacterium]|nr:acyl carrier protein [Acidobacteriaceae bacterium]
MTQQEIYPRLTKIMRDVFDDDNLVVTPELTANDVEGWDSVSHITLVVAVEQAFAIKFKSAELEKMKNVGQLVEQIEKKTSAQ